MHTKHSLEEDLERAGIRHNDTVMIHSAMKAIGQVDGGGDTVIDALLDYFSHDGLLLFPTLTYTLFHPFDASSEKCQYCLSVNKPGYCLAKHWAGRKPEFHVNSTPACIGLLPNLFRVRPGVVRSLNPTHSVAAAGKGAREFCAGHEKGTTPCGKHSPWWKMFECGAKVLHLGSHVYNTTFMHGSVEWFRTPGRDANLLAQQVDVYDENEHLIPMEPQHDTQGHSSRFPMLEDEFKRVGAMSTFTFGNAEAILLDCVKITECTYAALEKDPELF